ncbi:MAG TPA: glutathione S-transferase C-terminal domain-containing protein [Cellulomonas sp.]
MTTTFPERTVEQTDDGAFRRQPNLFPTRFGDGPDQARPEPGRYRLLGSVSCGWARRQLITLRLLGLSEAVPFVLLYGRDDDGWRISRADNDLAQRWGATRLNEFYERTRPGFTGRGTSPTVIDVETGTVVTNNYHLLSNDFETAWQPFHAPDAPDLYPVELRAEIDLLNQQIFDDVNNGTYRVLFATNPVAASTAIGVFHARLAEYDFRLASRRYLFGSSLTDSDIRLFVTLSSYERGYRPRIAEILGEENVRHLSDFPNLWAYARDLFAQGLADEREQYFLGLVRGANGEYVPEGGFTGSLPLPDPGEALAAWQEPSGREHLTGSPLASGPGTAGTAQLWHLG